MQLKKLFYFLFGSLLLMVSCQKQPPKIKRLDWSEYQKGYQLIYRKNDSAFYYFNKVATSSRDSLQIAMAYNSMALIQSDAGDYYGAEESAVQSLKFLNENDPRDKACQSTDYNELGLAAANLRNYSDAIKFYKQALRITADESLQLTLLNNIANAYVNQKNYATALQLYAQILQQTAKKETAYARVITNQARARWLKDPHYRAAPELLEALHVREKEHDLWGQNSSYAHLADYYSSSHADSAFLYANQMYRTARQLHSSGDQVEALQKLIELGRPEDTRQFFFKYRFLTDSIQNARNAARNQFALIRYQAEKTKADNVKLQKDNAEKKYQIVRQQFLLGGSIFLLITGSVLARIWYRKRKLQLAQDAHNAIRDHELSTSKKVHDVVANGLYRIMAELEHRNELDKNEILDQIEGMYERSRDISYEKSAVLSRDFSGHITSLITSFAGNATKVVVKGNNLVFWDNVSATVRNELEQVLQEMLVNMKKHSHASSVAIRFERREQELHIAYKDNGTGIPDDVQYGNGLRNTGNRIAKVQGTITFESQTGKGLKINISVPVA